MIKQNETKMNSNAEKVNHNMLKKAGKCGKRKMKYQT